ncbi:HBL/NHE enterotoxin family protein [Jeotgalibacillus marinus]|uniref:HBL/NHE enterotoxin family protein n=1 Tax=Jeotgalibacillus marinus TaxID=86667 RepID=A0ABV3Q3W4_9BACL
MKKQAKRFIALGLTVSLASVPTLSEVSQANEISDIQEQSLSLLSTEIDEAMLSMEANRLSSEDLALSTLQQPVIDSPLEGMEEFTEQQQAMNENAEKFLDEYNFELKDAHNRAEDIAEKVDSYMATADQKVKEFENGEITEEKARNDIRLRLERLNTLIKEEARTVEQSQERVEDFHLDVEKDYKELEASVKKAEEVLIEQGDVTEEEVRGLNEALDELYAEQINQNRENLRVGMMASSIADGPIASLSAKKINFFQGAQSTQPDDLKMFPIELAIVFTIIALGIVVPMLYLLISTIINFVKGPENDYSKASAVKGKSEAMYETTGNVVNALDDYTNAWNKSQEGIQIMIEQVSSDNDLSTLKPIFKEASDSWGTTQNIAKMNQQLEANTSDDPIKINLDGIDTEEDLEEALKAYDFDELIDTSDFTDKELKEWLESLEEDAA